MASYLSGISTELGISLWLLTIILIWSFVWKLLALWKSARKGQKVWFVILALINTVGILEILYIYVFSKIGERKTVSKKVRKKKKR
ncbi:MAG: DUF5652 family protein [Nanoarchaeota archaeon]|nr:DUF5652 family protein [Nanoarchaeota archaeon]